MFWKWLYKKATRKEWTSGRADPTACTSYTWNIPRLVVIRKHTVRLVCVFDVSLQMDGHTVKYGGRLLNYAFWSLEDVRNDILAHTSDFA